MTHLDAVRQQDVAALCRVRLGLEPAPGQVEIIHRILFRRQRRLAVCCTTRYGKSKAVAAAIVLWIGYNAGKRVAVVAPTMRQTAIIREYVLDYIVRDAHVTAQMIDWGDVTGPERLKKELNRERYAFTNGTSLSFYTAEGEGSRLMGWGADLIVEDEAGLIEDEVYRTKISRMLGDNPDSQIVEIGNPWSRDSHFYTHWTNPRWDKVHVGWEQAVREGRLSQAFIDEQRGTTDTQGEVSPMEFQILYESNFPDQSEDSLFNYQKILAAMDRTLVIEPRETIVGADIADKGVDETVIWKTITDGHNYKVIMGYSEAKSELTAVAGKILKITGEPPRANTVNIDCIGVGAGVLSMVKEANPVKTRVNGCHYGSAAKNNNRFLNAKAEHYFALATLFDEGRIQIPKNEKLIRDLLGIKWTLSSGSKIKIEDPDKSPDYADALVYATWVSPQVVYGIG